MNREGVSGTTDRRPHRHSTFYFRSVVFLVEDVLFCLPRHQFEQNSEVFRHMFECPIPPVDSGQAAEGTVDENPIRLEGIELEDFEQLLKIMFHSPSASGPPQLSCDEWVSVLKLSTMWQFAEIRARAVRELSAIAIDAVRKVVLAKKFSVDQWLLPALNEIARRAKPIDVEDIEKLGLEYALKLAEVRESFTESPKAVDDGQHSSSAFGSAFGGPYGAFGSRTIVDRQQSCNSCARSCYWCAGHETTSRSDHDFTGEIRRVFNLA